MQRLAQSFSEQRTNLEKQWEAAEKVSTEELRVARRDPLEKNAEPPLKADDPDRPLGSGA